MLTHPQFRVEPTNLLTYQKVYGGTVMLQLEHLTWVDFMRKRLSPTELQIIQQFCCTTTRGLLRQSTTDHLCLANKGDQL